MISSDNLNDNLNNLDHTILKCNMKNLINENINIPGIQRLKNDSKVDEIVSYQLEFFKKYSKWNFMGVINIHYVENDSKFYLIDGQHRFEACKNLYTSHGHNIHINVELVKVSNFDQLRQNYKILNQNTVLPDISENIDKSIPEEATLYFFSKYKSMFTNKSRANRPHVNFNFFQEALGITTEKLALSTSKELIDIIAEHNINLAKRDRSTFPDSKKISDTMWKKCADNKLFMGLYKYRHDDYAFKWVKDIVYSRTGKQLNKTNVNKKKRIPKKVKTDSWNLWMGPDTRKGNCKCCQLTTIDITRFDAGHIISEKNGGGTDIDNIIPLCNECNLSMSSTNIAEYMQYHYPKNKLIAYSKPTGSILGSVFGY